MYKFIHAADIHLDSPLLGLQRYEGAPIDQIRGATRKALAKLIDLTIEQDAKFLLIAGDVYDGTWKDYNTGLYFNAQMSRLRDKNIPVLLIRGNHDSASEITKRLTLPDNVYTLSCDAPETRILDDLGVAIHGQGFAAREVTQNLVARYPLAVRGLLNIGMLHTSCTGRDGHDTYAPCTLEELARKEYGYWALGHIHGREVLNREPWIVFPGNLQGRHIRETGGKGASIVTVEGQTIKSVEHRDVDVFRWAMCEVDAQDAADSEDVLERLETSIERQCNAAQGRPLAMRVQIVGQCDAHAELSSDAERWKNEARARATTASGGRAWLQQVSLHTALPDAEYEADTDGPESDLLAILAELEVSDDALLQATAGLRELEQKLPPELRAGPEAIALGDKTYLRHVLADVRQMLLPQLAARE